MHVRQGTVASVFLALLHMWKPALEATSPADKYLQVPARIFLEVGSLCCPQTAGTCQPLAQQAIDNSLSPCVCLLAANSHNTSNCN